MKYGVFILKVNLQREWRTAGKYVEKLKSVKQVKL